MAITLDELKAENAAADEAAKNNQVDDKQEAIKDEYVEVVEDVKADAEESKSEDEGEQETTLESWQLTDDTVTSDDDKKSGFIPNHEAAKRRKQAKALKGELNDTKDENTELKERIAALEAGNAPQAPKENKLPSRPTREQFDYDDDAYDAAVDDWNDKKLDARLNDHAQKSQTKSQQESQQQAAIATQQKHLDDHYGRASKLVEDGKVTEESYKNADSVVRQSLEAILPKQGNTIANALISTLNSLGDGSEKVMYQLGRNPAKLQELQNKLVSDPSGLAASAFLGQLQSQIQSPVKKQSNAPKPGSKVDGEGGSSGRGGTAQKEYNKTDDTQTRINIKRKAKNAGIDVSNW